MDDFSAFGTGVSPRAVSSDRLLNDLLIRRVQCCIMRCFIGFFGLTRSLRYTSHAIRDRIYQPLHEVGIQTVSAGHFNLPEIIMNPRSGELNVRPDRSEAALLDLDLCWVEAQSDAATSAEFRFARNFPDSFGDQYRSLGNLCHQLHSLERLWSLLKLLDIGDRDIILLLRPDLLYLDRLDPAEDLAPLFEGRADLIVPGWQSWGGLNDRFAFCTARAARIYATRLRLFVDACKEMGGMHAETFLRHIVAAHALRVGLTGLRAARVRADGRFAGNDLAMFGDLIASNTVEARV